MRFRRCASHVSGPSWIFQLGLISIDGYVPFIHLHIDVHLHKDIFLICSTRPDPTWSAAVAKFVAHIAHTSIRALLARRTISRDVYMNFHNAIPSVCLSCVRFLVDLSAGTYLYWWLCSAYVKPLFEFNIFIQNWKSVVPGLRPLWREQGIQKESTLHLVLAGTLLSTGAQRFRWVMHAPAWENSFVKSRSRTPNDG